MTGTDLGMAVGFATLASFMIALFRLMKVEARELRQEFKTLRENDLMHIGVRLGDLRADMDTRFGEVNARFADLAMSLNSRIDRVDGRITGVEGRLGEQIESVRQDVRDVRHDVREVRQEVRGMRSELRGVIDGLKRAS